MNCFISGPITAGDTASPGAVRRNRRKLTRYARQLRRIMNRRVPAGCVVLNPAILPLGMAYADYMAITRAMINQCDTLVLAPGWRDSKGARNEAAYAENRGMDVHDWEDL